MTLPFDLDIFAAIASLVFTLMIFSYLIGDNFLFRIALYIFTGVSAGYIAAVAWWQVLVPRLIIPLWSGSTQEAILLIFPLLGILIIFLKILPSLAGAGRLPMAFIVGAGAGVTLIGALSGTLVPQVADTVNSIPRAASVSDPSALAAYVTLIINGFFVLLGTVLSLIYFHFGAHARPDGSIRRLGVIEMLAWLGRIFIGVTLGVVFAGVYAAALTALIERVSSIINLSGIIP